MSQHVVKKDNIKYVFGWDQMLMSFYLQVHDMTLDEDEQIVAWYGATPDKTLYEVSDLVIAAYQHGLKLSPKMGSVLYGEKDDGI